MAHTIKISDAAREVLARSQVSETRVVLPPEQLDRALYLEVNKALAAAGGKWNRKERAHLFERDPREALGVTVQAGTAVRQKQATQAFYTPAALADRIAERASLRPAMRVLEPSCGEGALILAALRREPGLRIRAYDIDEFAVKALEGVPQVAVYAPLDFLEDLPPGSKMLFHRVLMNPPFTQGQDIRHVTHAISYVRPGGRLVSVMSRGWRTSALKRAVAFRALLDDHDTEIEDIPAGTFKESGTDVPTLLVTIDVR